MSEEMLEFNNIITLRNHLCRFPLKKLMEIYQDKSKYISFVDAVALLMNCDSAFLLFSDEFLEKILSVLQIHRFDFEEHEVGDCINGIISYINDVKTYPQELKNQLKNGYLAYQEDLREVTFKTTLELLSSISFDAFVFACLRDDQMDRIQDDKYFLMSFNYLMKSVPEFFQDPEVCKRASLMIDRIGRETRPLSQQKKYYKKVRSNFQELLQKEE